MTIPKMPEGKGWRANDGTASPPKGTRGKTVDVVLRNGRTCEGWPADRGRPETRWTLTASSADILFYRVR